MNSRRKKKKGDRSLESGATHQPNRNFVKKGQGSDRGKTGSTPAGKSNKKEERNQSEHYVKKSGGKGTKGGEMRTGMRHENNR